MNKMRFISNIQLILTQQDIGLYQSESKDNYVVGDSALRVLRSEMDVISYCPNDGM